MFRFQQLYCTIAPTFEQRSMHTSEYTLTGLLWRIVKVAQPCGQWQELGLRMLPNVEPAVRRIHSWGAVTVIVTGGFRPD
jgi:hypothetical protein